MSIVAYLCPPLPCTWWCTSSLTKIICIVQHLQHTINKMEETEWIWNQIYSRHFGGTFTINLVVPVSLIHVSFFIQSEIGNKAGSKHHWYTGELIFSQNRRRKGGSQKWNMKVLWWCQNCTTRWQMWDNRRDIVEKRSLHCKGACHLCHLHPDLLQYKSKNCCCHFVCNVAF